MSATGAAGSAPRPAPSDAKGEDGTPEDGSPAPAAPPAAPAGQAPPADVGSKRVDAHLERAVAGRPALLWQPASGRRLLTTPEPGGARKVPGLGVFDLGRLVDQPWGTRVQAAGAEWVLVRPTPPDLAATVRRKAQIITPKDAARIVQGLGVGSGDRVLESGVGSGAASLALAWAVGAAGRVVAQELRGDFAQVARDNLAAAGLADRVEVHIGDLTQGLADGVEGPFDAALLDQPEPWRALAHVAPALRPGARLACYSPQVNQMERAHRGLVDAGFAAVEAMEIIERRWEVKERGCRPAFEGPTHTGFLVFARWPGTEPGG